jgi:biopolymer transport protein ExbD
MKSLRRPSATINTGSMADIAFLLLIFFLVSTTISADKGILRQLPSDCPLIEDCTQDMSERNILRITLNNNQAILVNDKVVKPGEVKSIVKDFVDNNGTSKCDYCHGQKLSIASDHPSKAVISLNYDTLTKYHLYVSVQDEITKAYYELRARYVKDRWHKTPEQITDEEFKTVTKAYPFLLSEVKLNTTN